MWKWFSQKATLTTPRGFILEKNHTNVANVGSHSVRAPTSLNSVDFTVEKVLECGELGKAFGCKSNSVWPQRTHTGVRPYECDKCEKLFRQSFRLVEHQRIHTTTRPYACNQCKKSFSQKAALFVHQRVNWRKAV